MYWRIQRIEEQSQPHESSAPEGRFVVQKHRDADGDHLDLRLEQEGYLLGWRIDATALQGELYASEKGPHPVEWLEGKGQADTVSSGAYRWRERNDDGGILELHGQDEVTLLTAQRLAPLPIAAVRAITEVVRDLGISPEQVGLLIADGVTARERAVARLCGLGRELDGEAFDEDVARKGTRGLTLEEVHRMLRAYEARFDAAYPPEPVSRPSPLQEDRTDPSRDGAAMAIMREE